MPFLLFVNNFILLFTLAVTSGLGLYIFSRGKKDEVSRIFSFILFFIALWTGSFIFFILAQSGASVLFWRRLTPVASAFLAANFLYFSLIFPRREVPLPYWQKWLIISPAYFFGLISVLTPLLVKAFVITDPNLPFLGSPVFGLFYPLYAVYLALYFGAAILNLAYKYMRSKGKDRLQLFYVLFGMAASVLTGIIVSLIFPILGVSDLFTLGPSFTLFLVGFVTYAIVRHRLWGIEDFLTRGMVFLAAAAAAVGTLVFVLSNNLRYLLPFYTALGNFILAAFVFFNNRRSKINISFALIPFGIVLWSISIFIYSESTDLMSALIWSRIAAAASACFPWFFLYFTHFFPKEEKPLTLFKLAFWNFFGAFFVLISFSSWIVNRVIISDGRFDFVPGIGFPFFILYYLIFLGWAFYNLFEKHGKYVGTSKLQIKYVFFSFLVGSFFPIVTNLILPLFGRAELAGIGPFFTLLAVGTLAYAILKHRLMSIEVVIQRSMVYAAVTVLIMALYALAVIVSEIFLRQVMGYTSLLVTAAAALLIAIAYQPLIRGFQGISDRLFFRGRYDYQKTLREISHKIAAVIRLEELTRIIVSLFVDTMGIAEISFLLLDREKEHFRSAPISLPRYKKIEIDVGSPIVSWLSSTKDILVRDEIEDEISHQEALGKAGEIRRQSLEEVRDEMERLGIMLWVPIISKEELIGIIALGNKLSGDIFTSEDIGLLSTLAGQTAVALDNARLYNEVVNMRDYSEEILQSMVSGVMTVDPQAKVVTFNNMAEKITGRKANEVLGKSCEEVWGKRGTIPNVIANSLKDRCYINFESSVASPERGLVPVAFTSTVLRDHQEKKIGALLTIRDLSEVKELEEKVRRADKLSALATMAAGMAHEIKNPLSSMKVFSQLLTKKFDDGEFRKKFTEVIPREINRIDRIVESLLSFARATALNFERTDINDILEENMTYFEDQAKASEVKLIRDYSKELPEVEVDRGQISQVFSNLMLNAIQAMADGGELRVSSMPGKKVLDAVQNVRIVISDTGHGMPEETVQKLFDPFFTTKYGGTGLGMTISHNIVDGHRGYIDVESKVGKGTTFTVTLPVSQGLV